MRNCNYLGSVFSKSMLVLGLLFFSSPANSESSFFDIQVPNWNPASREVIVGIQAKVSNNCSFIDEIDSVISASSDSGIVELNIYVKILDVPYNIEPEFAKEIGCENGENYIYEKVNFGVLEPGIYVVQVIENSVVSVIKKINVSKIPANPDFIEPGGYYNIGEMMIDSNFNLLGSL